jgi:tRNA nucleotidyltransferase (CCA-adding enzyme)
MATAQDYQVGTAAAQTVIQADINQDVPVFFRGDIPAQMVAQIAASVAKAVIDAVDTERAKQDANKRLA